MTVDAEPLINGNVFEVEFNIDTNEDVNISINGLLAIFDDDIIDITDNKITVVPGLDINWDYDSFAVFYVAIS